MAKWRKVNKTAMVQDYMANHPNAGPAEVAASLKEHDITAAYVSKIKTKLKRGASNNVQKRQGSSTGTHGGSADKNLMAAAHFIKSCGGIEEAVAAFEIARKVARVLHE